VRQLSAHSVEHRIAFTLLKLADKFGERQGERLLIQTPLARDELAEMTGTTTESASRAISGLQKAGLIETGRQWVAILDRESLEALLEE
jgi:CRP-like cAMP-binding protein